MINFDSLLDDPELGSTSFSVERTTYHRSRGNLVPVTHTSTAIGCVHPGTPEMLQLMPEEERQETFLVIYTSFPLSAGVNESGPFFRAADRIRFDGRLWRVVRVRDWSMFGYVQAIAVVSDSANDSEAESGNPDQSF